MGLNFSSALRKALMSTIFAVMLIPALVSASTEYKGTETVNINKANASTLSAYLKGVGPSKAEAIVKYRNSNGKFSKIDDLKNVPGIGDQTYKDMKKNVSTSRGKSVAPDGYKMGKASTSSSKKKTSKKSTSSKTSSSSSSKKSSKIADTDKKASTKKTSSKKSTSSKKTDAKKTSPKKKTTSKKTTTKKKTTKKPTKKKTTKKKTTKDKK